MKTGKLILLLLTGIIATPLRPALADVVIIDSGDTIDWARVMTSYHWKDKDTVLRPNALLKFDLGDLPAGAVITAAGLYFYTEKSRAGGTIAVGHVADHSWSFLATDPGALYKWPVVQTIFRYPTGSTGWRKVDVTKYVQAEFVLKSRLLSLKWTDELAGFPRERIVSPSSRDSDKRPYLRIEYQSLLPVVPRSDLTLGPADIRLGDPTPAPKRKVQVTATIRNNGPGNAENVQIQLFDGDPDEGGVPVSLPQKIALIPAGGGTGETMFRWSASPGTHRLYVVVDPANTVPELDEGNNRGFAEVAVRNEYTKYRDGFETTPVSGSGSLSWSGLQTPLGPWGADGDLPFDSNIDLARQWHVRGTRTEAHEGHRSLFMYLDGRSDDGTIWVERWIPVDPDTNLTVDLSFAFGREANIATAPVYYIGFTDPEMEDDFELLPLEDGWHVYKVSQAVFTGERTRLWIAVGLTVSWETEVYHYLDSIDITVR